MNKSTEHSMKPVKQISLKEKMSVNDLVKEMEESGVMGAGRIGKAVSIYEKMIKDRDCKKFFGLAGAMVPGGMKNIVIELLERHWIDVFVSTGANLTHDLIEALGFPHLKGTEKVDDSELYKKGIDRIYDSCMSNEVYSVMEEFCFSAFDEMPKKEIGIREFLFELGKRVPTSHSKSILHTCFKEKIPVFCPAIADSGIGLMAWNYSLKKKGLSLNAFSDLKEMMELAWNAENKKEKLGAIIVGGGTPKNFIAQSFQFSPRKAMYAVQITMDRPEPGGSSGAELREAISWGKLDAKAEFADVICDATIALPVIVAALKDRIK